MEIDYAEIGRNIREHRRRCGMKQKELAELINVSDQHISHIENGYTKLSLVTLVAIAMCWRWTATPSWAPAWRAPAHGLQNRRKYPLGNGIRPSQAALGFLQDALAVRGRDRDKI